VALTPEASAALGAHVREITRVPYRVGRESHDTQRTAHGVVPESRDPGSRPTHDLYLRDRAEPLNVSREHFVIDRLDAGYGLVDHESTCGTLVEGEPVGGSTRAAPARCATPTSSSSAPRSARTSSSSGSPDAQGTCHWVWLRFAKSGSPAALSVRCACAAWPRPTGVPRHSPPRQRSSLCARPAERAGAAPGRMRPGLDVPPRYVAPDRCDLLEEQTSGVEASRDAYAQPTSSGSDHQGAVP
jgi:FHA domain